MTYLSIFFFDINVTCVFPFSLVTFTDEKKKNPFSETNFSANSKFQKISQMFSSDYHWSCSIESYLLLELITMSTTDVIQKLIKSNSSFSFDYR